jgi:hypothetical protein
LPWGSQNKVTVLDPNCNSLDVWGRDIVGISTVPPPPPPPTIAAAPTSSPGPGVIKTGTLARVLTRDLTGGASGTYIVTVNFGDGFTATGTDVTHTYASAGVYQPFVSVIDASGNSSGLKGVLGGDGQGVFTVLSDPGLAVTSEIYRLTADQPSTTTVLAPVSKITANVSAGLEYSFEAVLFITADITGGIKVGIDGTCSATEVIWEMILNPVGDAAPLPQTSLGNSEAGAGFTSYYAVIKGTIKVNAAGTIYPVFAQKIASGTSSVLKGSEFKVELVQPHA